MASLTNLPLELIHHILSKAAAEDPPSKKFLHEEPSASLLHSVHHPLKDLVQTSRLLHDLSCEYLFTSLKADIRDIARLILFTEKHSLRGRVSSLLLYLGELREERWDPNDELTGNQPPCSLSEPTSTSTWRQIKAVVDVIDPSSLTFMLPPAEYECILPYELDLADEWAFHTPYQLLRLDQGAKEIRHWPVAGSLSDYKIFGLRPWSHITFNEGCSVQAFSTYEFFDKTAPSIMHPKTAIESILPSNVCPSIVSVDHIAVFPICDIVQNWSFLSRFSNLKFLRLQFAPSPSNKLLDDPVRLGKCQRSDLWSELRQAYLEHINALGFQHPWDWDGPSDFTILDYSNPGINEMLDEEWILSELGDWYPQGKGHWARNV